MRWNRNNQELILNFFHRICFENLWMFKLFDKVSFWVLSESSGREPIRGRENWQKERCRSSSILKEFSKKEEVDAMKYCKISLKSSISTFKLQIKGQFSSKESKKTNFVVALSDPARPFLNSQSERSRHGNWSRVWCGIKNHFLIIVA